MLVSDAVPPSNQNFLAPLDQGGAAAYRGRCHGPQPPDHDDNPCYTCPCPPGSSGNHPPGSIIPSSYQPNLGSGGGCGSCGSIPYYTGAPTWLVSDPYLSVWLQDVPLAYTPAFGPPLEVRLAYHDRHEGSTITGSLWHGAKFGNTEGAWSCSLLSFAELDASESAVELMLPAGGWATFSFPANSNTSDVNYRHNLVLEKQGPSGGVTNLVLHHPDGSQAGYAVLDNGDPSGALVFYVSTRSDPSGGSLSFQYDGNFYLTNVVAADGASLAVYVDDSNYTHTPLITNVTSSFGASAWFNYLANPVVAALTNITDAAGISSQLTYEDGPSGGPVTALKTPYGTTSLSTYGDGGNHGIFDRTARITLPNGTVEFYGQMNEYTGNDWPDFDGGQIPSSTPVGTLDTSERQERNTFYWNAQQFAPYVNTSLYDFTWDHFKKGRIRHWLASTDLTYTHFDTLSLEQAPSPDGSAEGQITWYDYAGKPAGTNYERGTQIFPSVIARVMPDGTTAYQYFQYNSIGKATNAAEKWVDGGNALYRTNSFVYAANGVDMVAWTNAASVRASTNIFNSHHQIATNYDALNQVTIYTYDASTFQLTSVSRPSGLVTTNYYDGSHRLQQVTDLPINRTLTYTWYASGNVQTVMDERGSTTTNYWDALNRLTGTSDGRGTTSNLYYRLDNTPYPNSSGGVNILDVTASKDRAGYWTYFDYDSLRRKIAETNANGAVTRYGYCDCGAMAYATNAFGTSVEQATTFNYDYQGNRISIYGADGYNVTNWFDSLGQMTETGDGWGYRWFFYDNLNRLTAVSNALGRSETTLYDLLDRRTNVTDSSGVTITNTFDDLGRLLSRGYPGTGVEKFGYSARGLTVYTNQLGFTNAYGYDEAGHKTAETNGNGEIISYAYDSAGDLLTLTDGKGQVTTWHYDIFGRVSNKLDQASVEILRYGYDGDDRLTSRWSKAKGTTYYTNDAVGNLININYPSSADVTNKYDWLNRLTNMVDGSGATTYGYTAGNQLLTEDGPFASDTVTNTYANRLRTALSLQQPTGSWTNGFGYDAARRLTNVISPAGTFTNEYLTGVSGASGYPSLLVKRRWLANGSVITNDFDGVGRLLATHLRTGAGTLTNKHEYQYDLAGRRTNETRLDASTVAYSYDSIGQLVVANSSVNAEDRGYYYDAAWNLNRRTNNGVTSTFKVDGKNQLTNAPVIGTQSYDDNGNLTSGGGLWYSYDDENRLANCYYYDAGYDGGGQPTTAEDSRMEFVYDGLGRLRKRVLYTATVFLTWDFSSEIRLSYDGMRVIQERNGSNTPTVSYTRGNDLSGTLEGAGGIGGLLGRSHGYSGGNWSTHNVYHADGNGNVTYMLNSSQSVVASYRYDPFGNAISSSGSLSGANTYRFSSKELVTFAGKGVYYYLYRFYDPNLQRWMNRDPVSEWGGVNLYRFVQNRPTTRRDPYGLADTGSAPSPRPPNPIPPIPPIQMPPGGTEGPGGGWWGPGNAPVCKPPPGGGCRPGAKKDRTTFPFTCPCTDTVITCEKGLLCVTLAFFPEAGTGSNHAPTNFWVPYRECHCPEGDY